MGIIQIVGTLWCVLCVGLAVATIVEYIITKNKNL